VDARTEKAILDALVARGLVPVDELGAPNEASRLVDLVERGLVSDETIADLARDLRREAEPPSDPTAPFAVPGQAVSLPRRLAGRYVLEGLLGQGAMARVYRAHDAVLHRAVALKLLEGDDPGRAERFVAEARAQARVRHDNVCQVFDAGSLDGTPFIAMQLVEGEPLHRAAERMTVPQKARALLEIAEGVHAAHRLGLVHRDLKPSNVMVEWKDGAFHPYVVDFGLVRDLEGPGLTVTGQTVGTPAYMAPEQARGEIAAMDRRTDVYGLGATLFHVLTGRPPFSGATALDVMLKVIDSEPPSPRSVIASVPVDLDTIVLKCLEKNPDRRYDSARAVADDLRRYLEGEPVLARRQTAAGRLLSRMRKNRVVASALLVAVVALSVSALLQWRTHRAAEARTRLAQQYGRELERIDTWLRVAFLLPLHDVRPDQRRVREKMAEIRKTMAEVGSVAVGPGRYALGKGHLALNEPSAARTELEAAWNAGFRPPEMAYALGRALGDLYQRALEEARRVPGRDLREAQLRTAREELRKPALALLRDGRGAVGDSVAFAEGLVALHEERWDDALRKAEAAARELPWLYEARLLAGHVHVAVGRSREEKGDSAAAFAAFERAGAAYREAREVGRSDPLVYEADARRWLAVIDAKGRRGQDPHEAVDKALESARLAQTADPGSRVAPDVAARALFRDALFAMLHGGDPAPRLAESVRIAREALERGSDSAALRADVGSALAVLGEGALSRGEDARPVFREAVSELQRAHALDSSSPTVPNALGNALLLSADAAALFGDDPLPLLLEAREAYAALAGRHPDLASPAVNLGHAYQRLAREDVEQGRDPGPNAREAEAGLRRAIAIDPKLRSAPNNLGHLHLTLAEHEAWSGRDPRPALRQAVGLFDTALVLDPAFAFAFVNRAAARTRLAAADAERGGDPAPSLAAARADLEKARSINPGHFELHLRLAELALLEWRLGRGPERASTAALDEAARRNPRSVDLPAVRAELALTGAVVSGRVDPKGLRAALDGLAPPLAARPGSRRLTSVREALLRALEGAVPERRPDALFPWRVGRRGVAP